MSLFGKGTGVEERRQNDIDIAVLKEKNDELFRDLAGLFKIFCLAIGALAIIAGGMFTFLWSEIKDVDSTVSRMRQIRQPSPSPQLPFKPYDKGER
jgi:hypothetical protein